VLALVVFFEHGFALPIKEALGLFSPPMSLPGRVTWLLLGNLWNGAAAVMLFFVISGFCIHYSTVGSAEFSARIFLIRRLVRIGIPLLVCLTVASLIFDIRPAAYVGIWSLVCELATPSIHCCD
jgi:peptidoglycan/LPS O-acetylase OafA/YrhL